MEGPKKHWRHKFVRPIFKCSELSQKIELRGWKNTGVLNGEGQLVELDGTMLGPVVVGDCGGDLLRGSIREVQGKLEKKEISESLSMMTLNFAQE